MKPLKVPDFDEVHAWCEAHDQHATEGWLCMLIDGSLSIDELRAAILEDRDPRSQDALAALDKALTQLILELPAYRGWEITTDDHPETKRETLVWKHDWDGGTEVTVWCRFDHPRGLIIDVYDCDDSGDLEGWTGGDVVPMPVDADQFFTACQRFLDAKIDCYEEMSAEYPKPATGQKATP